MAGFLDSKIPSPHFLVKGDPPMDPLVSLVFTIFFKLFEHPKPGGGNIRLPWPRDCFGRKSKGQRKKTPPINGGTGRGKVRESYGVLTIDTLVTGRESMGHGPWAILTLWLILAGGRRKFLFSSPSSSLNNLLVLCRSFSTLVHSCSTIPPSTTE